jgi:hypothetical protein
MRCRFAPALVALLALSVASVPATAQTVRGVVIDDSTKLPISSVVVTLVDDAGADVLSVRSDSFGDFTIHAGRPGSYRVRATRIGYLPLTSDRVSLGQGQLVALRLSMTTVAQQLVAVRVVERRRLNMGELMSSTGFDLRESKGAGTFLSGERLALYGEETAADILNRNYRHLVYVRDSIDGSVLLMRRGLAGCNPEIYIDAVQISSGQPEEAITGRAEHALAQLGMYAAKDLHGIEIYRAEQVPPPSLGGFIGSELSPSGRNCGAVAVWTKTGAKRLASARGTTSSGVQVIRGAVIDLHKNTPVAGVPVRLLSTERYPLSEPVISDSLGEFVIRTKRAGPIRLEAGSVGFQVSQSAPLTVEAEEVVLVRFFVSGTRPVLAPLGIAGRAGPNSYGVSDIGSFVYRRERGLAGAFFNAPEIQRGDITSLADLLRGVEGVIVFGSPAADSIAMRSTLPGPSQRCFPAYFVDGKRLPPAAADSIVRAIPLARILGVEVYRGPAEMPPLFAEVGGECGMIGIWKEKEGGD